MEVLFIVASIALIVASYTDIRTREVPDWLNRALLIFALGTRLMYSLIFEDYSFILEGLLGLAVFYLIGAFLYYTGQWGGGDAKMLIGLGATFGLDYANLIQPGIVFLYNLIFSGGIYGVFFITYLYISEKKKCNLKLKELFPKKIMLTLVLSSLILSYFSIYFLLAGLALVLLINLFVLVRAVEIVCFIKNRKVEKLTEGDWIVDDVVVGKTTVCGPSDLGITKEQIVKLKKLNVKSIKIKEGIPFIPSLLLAYSATIIFGDWLFSILLGL